MDQKKWGLKRLCQNCGTRFYDLNQATIVCPECNTPYSKNQYVRVKKKDQTPLKNPLGIIDDPIDLIDDDIDVVLDDTLDAESEDLDEDDDSIPLIKKSEDDLI